MKTELMIDPQEISQEIWFDETSQVVIINIDRISIALSIDELFEVIDRLDVARDNLISNFNVIIGTYEENGEKKKEHVVVSEDDEYH